MNDNGFGSRLAETIKQRGMTFRDFAAELAKVDKDLRRSGERLAQKNGATQEERRHLYAMVNKSREGVPHSYRAIMNYRLGMRQPTGVFVEAAASVLGVREEWLRDGKGRMTDAVEVVTTLNATAPSKVVGFLGPDATVKRLAQIAPPLATFRTGLQAFNELWGRFIRSSPVVPDEEDQLRVAEQLWQHVVAPLKPFGVHPKDAPEAYYLGVFSALLATVPKPSKGPDLSRKRGKKAQGLIRLGDVFHVPSGRKL
ncbi:MAG: hypothetical protein ABI681_08760 [Gemmatimonadales bacterium]